jgi:hypothetical protein
MVVEMQKQGLVVPKDALWALELQAAATVIQR